ncbi:MAG TPA: GntR family transcriptional regulator [Acidobacteriota bacterium]|nr:GntR family transcriptional regulator [Acidobacteriota bacterium]
MKTSSVVTDLYKKLLRDIMVGRIRPGEVLSEETLATRFKVSRTPVREVLLHLQNDGLLNKGPWRGYAVTEISVEALREIYHIRLLLEPEAARLAAQNPLAFQYLAQAEKAHAEEKECRTQELTADVLFRVGELDSAFHIAIAQASGNKSLARIIEMLRKQTQRFWVMAAQMHSARDVTVDEHEEVLQAIKARDPKLAEQLMREHVLKTIDRALQLDQLGSAIAIAKQSVRPEEP